MAQLLNDEEVGSRLSGSQWKREGEHIVRDLQFKNFADAMTFVNKVADAAEEANHHPDIAVHDWNKVRLSVTTHDAGGLTDSDFALADTIDALTP
jgi:4a-hydroxytetrahydrobiopterin dehydratase